MDYFKYLSSKVSTGSGNLYSKTSLLQKIDDLNNLIVNQNVQIAHLESAVNKRENIISRLQIDKQKLYGVMQSQQRKEENIEKERTEIVKENEQLSKEIELLKKYKQDPNLDDDNENILELQRENAYLKIGLKQSAETIYNLCTKFLKMKTSKDALKTELEASMKKTSRLTFEMTNLLEENRKEFKRLLQSEFKKGDKSSNKRYLALINKNNQVQYENTMLKMRLSMVNSCLTDTARSTRDEID